MKQLIKTNGIFWAKIILIWSLILGTQSILGQTPDSVWSKIYPGMVAPYKGSVAQTLDGGYIIISTNIISPATEGIYIIKTNSTGDTTWTKIFKSGVYAQSFNGRDILQRPDGDYIICGSYQPINQGPFHGLLYRLNSYGEPVWEEYFTAPTNYAGIYFRSVKPTSDSGYVCGGAAYGHSITQTDACIYKMDSVGYLQWNNFFVGNDDVGAYYSEEVAYSVHQLSQANGYIVAGRTKSLSSFYNNAYLVKTDANGDTIWTRSYGKADKHDVFTDVIETSDGNFLSVGYKTITIPYYILYMVKTDNNGDTLWTGTYPDNPVSLYNIRAFSVLETADHSGYVIAGDGENDSLLVLKTNTFGNILWTKKIQLGTNEFVQKIIQTSDGGFMVQGFTKVGPSASPYQLFLLKLEMEPTSIIIKKPTKISTVSLSYNYPNPFNPSTKIKYDLPKQENVKIEIFNLLGQKIETLVNKIMPAGSHQVEFNAKDLPSGVYLYRIEAVGFQVVKKMLLFR
jgi:type IX secretion system substrate protein